MQRTPIAEQVFGHNKAPLDEVLKTDFADLAAEVEAAVAKITATQPKVKDETDLMAIGQLAIDATKLLKRIESDRKDETDPLFQMQKAIKAHFDAWADRVNVALAPHKKAADDYTRQKVAEERRKREQEAARLREQEEAERIKAQGSGAAAARAEGRAEALANQAAQAEAAANAAPTEALRVTTASGGTVAAQQKWAFAIDDYEAIPLDKLRPYLNRDAVETAIRSMVRVNKGNTNLPGVRVYPDTTARFR